MHLGGSSNSRNNLQRDDRSAALVGEQNALDGVNVGNIAFDDGQLRVDSLLADSLSMEHVC